MVPKLAFFYQSHRILAVIVATLMLTSVSAVAFADFSQDGRRTANTAVDGSYVRVAGHGFSPEPNSCVIYSTLTYNSDGSQRQLQAGLVRCNSAILTNTCTTGHTFIERYNGGGYFCTPGYAFTNGTQYDSTVRRASATSTTMNASISGVDWEQGGFGLNDNIRAYAWGEATESANNCPEPSRGTFVSWKRYNSSVGWVAVTGSDVFHGGNMAVNCWNSISATQADGGFEVD